MRRDANPPLKGVQLRRYRKKTEKKKKVDVDGGGEERGEKRERERERSNCYARNFHWPFRKPRIMPADVRNNYCRGDVRRAYRYTIEAPPPSPPGTPVVESGIDPTVLNVPLRVPGVPRSVEALCIRRYAHCKLHM